MHPLVLPFPPMRTTRARLLLLFVVALAAACQRNASAPEEGRSAGATDPKVSYSAPRWPSYFKQPESIEELMPAARSLVRNTSGFLGVGMGVLKQGETVLLVPSVRSDVKVIDAIVKA